MSAEDTWVESDGQKVQVRHRDCPACGAGHADAPTLPEGRAPWTLKRCPACQLVYLVEAPVYESLSSDLAWEKSFAREGERRRQETPVAHSVSKKTRWRMRLLPRRDVVTMLETHVSAGNVIDIGCGGGGLANKFPAGWAPFGIEVSEALAREADALFRQRGGAVVHAPALDGLRQFPDAFFAGATLRSYLEHEAEPREVLAELHRVLAPGGAAILKVPNHGSINRILRGAKWCGFRFPDHLNYFSPATLAAMAERAGFEAKAGLLDRLPTSDNMYAVLIRR